MFRVLAQLDRAEQGISLEEVLQQIGFGRDVSQQFTKAFRIKWTKSGAEEKIRGVGLKLRSIPGRSYMPTKPVITETKKLADFRWGTYPASRK